MEKFKLQAAAMAAARAQKTIAIKKVYDRPKPYKWASQLALIAVITGAFSFLGAMGISKIVAGGRLHAKKKHVMKIMLARTSLKGSKKNAHGRFGPLNLIK